jgi:type II restriction enzyme
MGKAHWNFAIGNPPYQESRTNTKDMPVYNEIMDAVDEIADKVELITPGRFLFNAGATPKAWNEKMLSDPHFKVLDYEADSAKVFPNTDIKGGVAIHYHDATQEFEPVGLFSAYPELNSIKSKVLNSAGFVSINTIMYSDSAWRISKDFAKELPDENAKLKPSARRFFASNVFDVLSDKVFSKAKPDDGEEYICLYGRSNNERCYRWIKAKYVNAPDNLNSYKVFVPKSNGSGALGEVLSTPLIGQPLIGQPLIGHTQSFISIGNFKTKQEAEHCLKYIKSKFARCCLGLLKITQHNPPRVWDCVGIQDFTSSSDIDWSKSIPEIDQQLYRKYGLSDDEVKFIEEHVKAME